jgi:hypothetical protein
MSFTETCPMLYLLQLFSMRHLIPKAVADSQGAFHLNAAFPPAFIMRCISYIFKLSNSK